MKTVVFVSTREIPEVPSYGREKVLGFVYGLLSEQFEVTRIRYSNVLDSSMHGILSIALRFMKSLLRFSPLPIQVLLFHDDNQINKIVNEIERVNPEFVYIDGVRCLPLLRKLGQRKQKCRIIVDYDDLMSRRMDVLIRAREKFSLGYIGKSVPAFVLKFVDLNFVNFCLKHYERFSLVRAELECALLSDSQVFISSVDRKKFIDQHIGSTRFDPRQVYSIAPFFELRSKPVGASASWEFKRFVFIGSDSLVQNRKTIEYLCSIWKEYRPEAHLYIYGKIVEDYPVIENVHFEGYADSLGEVYRIGSVLLAPSFIAGGVKTKVVEALSYCCPVLGNKCTFEGLGLSDNVLEVSEARLLEIISSPKSNSDVFFEGVVEAGQFLSDVSSQEAIKSKWLSLFS